MIVQLKAHVERLIGKAAEAHDSADAMRFSQAAVNAANALNALGVVTKEFPETLEPTAAPGTAQPLFGRQKPEI